MLQLACIAIDKTNRALDEHQRRVLLQAYSERGRELLHSVQGMHKAFAA